MKRKIINYLDRYFDRKFQFLDNKNDRRNNEVIDQISKLAKEIEEIETKVNQSLVVAKKSYDNIPDLRQKLLKTRQTKEYDAVFKKKSPLVSVRIATYNRQDKLINKAIKSVLNQTYTNWELIVVGDHCTDSTEESIKKLNNPKIKFYNLPFQNNYPEDSKHKWMVAGSPGMNKGAELARGDWIAPLDDDDEFSPDHIEKLVALALKDKLEVVYGKLRRINEETGEELDIWSYPPEFGRISSQSMLYMKLIDFFEWDEFSWVIDEPGDWNIIRRMVDAGVNIGTTKDVVGTIYYTHYSHKK